MNHLEAFRNLMVMAASDGKLTDEEITFLSLRSTRWGLSDEQFASALRHARQPDAVLTIPATRPERLEMLRDLVRMMAIDGELAAVEKNLFAVAAARMEISDDELNRVLDTLVKPKPSAGE